MLSTTLNSSLLLEKLLIVTGTFPLKSGSIICPPMWIERKDRLDLEYILATYFIEKQNPISVSTDLVEFGSKTMGFAANKL